MHWGTDVLTGAVTGSAIGIGLPLLMHGRSKRSKRSSVALVPAANKAEVGVHLVGRW